MLCARGAETTGNTRLERKSNTLSRLKHLVLYIHTLLALIPGMMLYALSTVLGRR